MKSCQFHSIPQNPQIIKPISRGAFGRVFLARKRATGDVFAIKCILRKLWSVKLKGTWTEEKYNAVLGLQEWKAEFDSVFNKSRLTFSYGSPDTVPILFGALPHSTWNTYPHEYEDFATDASFLDEWSFDQFESIVNKSKYDPKLKQLIHEDQIVISLHLLGCDSNGHAHRPYSSIYLNNVKVVDRIAEGVYNLLENYFKDNQTAYIFTTDHGMSDKGSHGDGHWSLTDTPLVAWGVGVKHPRPAFNNDQDNGERFVDEHHMHDTPTPTDWGLSTIERADVNQADIAPLMVVLEVTIIFDIQISDAFSSVDISIPQARARFLHGAPAIFSNCPTFSANFHIPRFCTPFSTIVYWDYKVHRDEIHTKLVRIMRERLLLHSRGLPQIIETWYRADETDLQPSQFAKSITKEVGNVPYVVENGCGKFSKSPKEIVTIVGQWFGPILYSKSFKIFTSLSNKDV